MLGRGAPHARSDRRGGARRQEGTTEPGGARAHRRRARAWSTASRTAATPRPAVYGVNTGFGFLADVRISADEIRKLQRNLIRSHAAGVGAAAAGAGGARDDAAARAGARARPLGRARRRLPSCSCEMLNRGVHPVIPSKGSVGASGDLAPLAHLALVVMGEGEAILDGSAHAGRRRAAAGGPRSRWSSRPRRASAWSTARSA